MENGRTDASDDMLALVTGELCRGFQLCEKPCALEKSIAAVESAAKDCFDVGQMLRCQKVPVVEEIMSQEEQRLGGAAFYNFLVLA